MIIDAREARRRADETSAINPIVSNCIANAAEVSSTHVPQGTINKLVKLGYVIEIQGSKATIVETRPMKTCGQCDRLMRPLKSYSSKKWVSAKGNTRRHIQVVKTNWKCPKRHTVQTWRAK